MYFVDRVAIFGMRVVVWSRSYACRTRQFGVARSERIRSEDLLEHQNREEVAPKRVVVVGAQGFVGGAVMRALASHGMDRLGLGRADVDLLSDGAGTRLAEALAPGDAVVAVSAIAPAKNLEMVIDNMKIAIAIGDAVVARGDDITQVINISSDAVYGDTPTPLTEASATAPGSYHGIMHLAREVHLKEVCQSPLAILRPTLIYGAADPHNGYGPNKFRRLAANGDKITLFGEGEELRDHVLVDDVAEIVRLSLVHRSAGVLNVASGHVTSFRGIAEQVVALFDSPVQIAGSPRSGPMPHNGFRPFDIAATSSAFPTFRYTPLSDGLAQVHAEL